MGPKEVELSSHAGGVLVTVTIEMGAFGHGRVVGFYSECASLGEEA